MDDKKIDGDKTENLDELSKKAISSLFDDFDDLDEFDNSGEMDGSVSIVKSDKPLVTKRLTEASPLPARSPHLIKSTASPPPFKYGENNSDKEHEEYMQRAMHAAKRDRERREEEVRRKADVPPILKRTAASDGVRTQPAGKNLTNIPKDRKELMAREADTAALPFRLGIRHIMIGTIVIVLLVFAFLVFQTNAARRNFVAAEEKVEELEQSAIDYRARISDMEVEMAQMRTELESLRLNAETSAPHVDTIPDVSEVVNQQPQAPPSDQQPIQTPPPSVPLHPELALDENGNRIYILKPNETLWGVASRILGDGARSQEIVRLNNIPDPNTVPHGTRLIMPE